LKTGYSILLGEYLDATVLDYRDCEPFQVVCPICSEPLFKVQRKKGDEAIDYLSHYGAVKSYAGDCELRIDSQSRSAHESQNKTARDQRLQYFISVLQKLIAQDELYPDGTGKSQKYLNHSKALKWFCKLHYDHARKNMTNEADLASLTADYLRDMSEVGVTLKTSFAMSIQKRIAIDMWKYLLSNKGAESYHFLFNHAYFIFMLRLNTPRQGETAGTMAFMQQMLSYVSKIPETNKENGMKIFAEMGRTPLGPSFVAENFFTKAAAEISHEMIGCLLGLPYLESLKDRLLQKDNKGKV
jgi:hypothetical protein